MPDRRTGSLRVDRALALRGGLTLAEFGLRDRIWLDCRLTPARVRVGRHTFDLLPGQAVISMAAYAEEFGCHRRVVAKSLGRLVELGWFAAETSPRGTVVTCLRDPRDGSDLDVRAKGGGWANGGQPQPPAIPASCPPCGQPPCPPVAEPLRGCSSTPRGSTPDNDTGVAVKSPVLKDKPARASEMPPDEPPDGPPRGGRPRPGAPGANAGPSRAPEPLPASLAGPAAEARIPAGIVAGALLEGHPEGLVLAWLVSLARRRGRLRAPAAVFRWALRAGLTPAGLDHDQAKRQARGDLGCRRARAFGHQAARALAPAARPAPAARLSRRQLHLLERAREQFAGRPGALARLEREISARLGSAPTATHCHPPSSDRRRIA